MLMTNKIKWTPGGFYKDKADNYWCCVGVSSSHGAPYRMIKAFHGNGHNATQPVQAWAEKSGELNGQLLKTRIVSGPHDHPWSDLFDETEGQ